MRVVAAVVARGGSRRLPGKALLPFAGTTLIGWAVERLRATDHVDEVVVGSDSQEILDAAASAGATTVRRDPICCDEDRCTANMMIADMAKRIDGDVVLWAHPTNPLVRPSTYSDAVQRFLDGRPSGYDSLVSVTDVARHAWVGGLPFNYDPWEERHVPASELQPIRFQDGAVFVQRLQDMRRNSYFFGRNPQLFPIDPLEGWDIDTRRDYDAARRLLPVVWPGTRHDKAESGRREEAVA